MNDHDNEGDGPLNEPDPEANAAGSTVRPDRTETVGHQTTQGNKSAPGIGVDGWTIAELVMERWHWLVLGALVCAAAFYLLGWHFIRPKFTATAELQRYDPPGKSEFFKTTPLSSETFSAMLRSPALLQAVGNQVVPNIPPETLTKLIKIDPEPDSDMVKVQLAARDPREAVNLLNLYLNQVVQYTREQEKEQAAKLADEYLKRQVTQMDEDIKDLQNQFRHLPDSPMVTNKLAKLGTQLGSLSTNLSAASRPSMYSFTQQSQRLTSAMGELNDLLVKYTELHPLVQQKRDYIKELQKEITQGSGTTNLSALAGGPLGVGDSLNPLQNPEVDIINIKLRALEDGRLELLKRQREADLYAKDPPGSVKVFAAADAKNVRHNFRNLKIGAVTVFGGGMGMVAALCLLLLVEFMDNRLKNADDVTRVTKLPVLTSLGDLHTMKPEDRSQWAFRAWTMLQGRLSPSPNFGLVCGITSSSPGEGRSTWISLLAEAASMTGFRVLTIATRPSPTSVDPANNHKNGSNGHNGKGHGEHFGGFLEDFKTSPTQSGSSNALTTSVLTSPSKVTEQLTGPNSQPVVHIPLPGWVWNLDRRKQWREALTQWRQIDNLVILVELPPACVPEAVLLGSNLPNMLWLTTSGAADAGETRAQLETLRHARCNLVGAVLNREPGVPVRRRFPRWLGCFAVVAALNLTVEARAQESNTPPAQVESADQEPTHTGSFSIVSPAQRAAWQQHLTLGPGDVLSFHLYGQPELTRPEVTIAPDGRINYLEATNVLASGLTVDELRAKLDEQLGLFRRSPRTIIVPVAFKSKKYYMLGKVTTKGVYTLDRPLTVLEALARAHGLESALVDQNIVSLADFNRSFLARGGKRYPLNFQKLFARGDLSQNLAVEPGDYIYFAPGDASEVYVVGEVRLPGPVTYRPDMTIISAITGRGGYSDRAFKMRVLVIRGSLQNPERFVVDTHAILDGRAPDFKLLPRDIVYVNSRPFIKVEEAADLAATAFIQTVITSWVGVDVIKPFK